MADRERAYVQELTLEDVMGDRFGRYSKYIIQERALPDIRDGLKPVQRRILFAMDQEGNTSDKAFRKSAKTVGNVIGNYHPHGDTSVYDAMVRMSQDWKMRTPMVEMQGNNGSMDGDPPAAMRYTEARLSSISDDLLEDIDKETVDMVLNFDDTIYEPTVLPARYPNLLVNGATGISAGYATDIPPHNLTEVVNATLHLIDNPDATTKQLMKYVKGPDFPTGGIIQGKDQLLKAYETGKGKIVVRSKTRIEDLRGAKQQIVIDEIPYEVNKSVLVRKMDEIRINKKIDGIADVRDETDREGLRIVVELKKDVPADGILTYLFKNTDLQISYSLNMIAIDRKRPSQVGLKTILTSYLDHKREVILRRTRYLLNKADKRIHIVEGLIKAISILDRVIEIIRDSENKADSKKNIMNEFDFTEAQAEAIVSMQLYRLSNTDITQLQNEEEDLRNRIKEYNGILNSNDQLNQVVSEELIEVRDQYKMKRLTDIEAEIEELKVEEEILVAEEDVMVSVTKEGYLKQTSMRSFKASDTDQFGMKESDSVVFAKEMSTLDQILIFTTAGNSINRKVHELIDTKWKDAGEHISQNLSMDPDEYILKVYPIRDFQEDVEYVFVTHNGNIKKTAESEFQPKRTYKTRSAKAIKLKDDQDELMYVERITPEMPPQDIFIVTYDAMGLRYSLDEVNTYGAQASGVKAINLKDSDYVVDAQMFATDSKQSNALIVTNRGSVKKLSLANFDEGSRANRGQVVLRTLKTNPHKVQLLIEEEDNNQLTIITKTGKEIPVEMDDFKVSDRYNNGTFILDENTDGQPETYRYDLETLIETKDSNSTNESN